MRAFFLAIAALFLTACNPVENLDTGDNRIADYQNEYSEADVDALWRMVGPEFREVTSREQFDDLVAVLQARLGAIESSSREGFNVNTNTGGTVTVVQMLTQFEQGQGLETYTFRGNGDDMQLIGWHVNSDRLTLTPDDLSRMRDEVEADEDNPVTETVE